MRDPQIFRQKLATRIFGLLGVASLAVPYAACRSGTVGGVGTSTATAGSSGGIASAATTTTATQATSTSGQSQSSAGAGEAGGAGAGGGGGAGGAAPNPPAQSCFDWPRDGGTDAGDWPADAGCPTDPTTAVQVFESVGCPLGWEPFKVVSGPTLNEQSQCCYMVYVDLCGPGGRPYLVEGQGRTAGAERGSGARGWVEGERPRLDGLTAEERAALAQAWTADALLEHASVASFGRFALALLAAGAPAELVEMAHRAALDEIGHARLCFALASAYAGEAIVPGPFPLGDVRVDSPYRASGPGNSSLEAIAVSTFEEGCIGETVAAVLAAEQLARATDPAVRAALAQIAADEARHAELAWRTVAWAVSAGGVEVYASVERALHATLAGGCAARDGGPSTSAAREDHGRLDAATTARAVAAAMNDVVIPAALGLLRALAHEGGSAGAEHRSFPAPGRSDTLLGV